MILSRLSSLSGVILPFPFPTEISVILEDAVLGLCLLWELYRDAGARPMSISEDGRGGCLGTEGSAPEFAGEPDCVIGAV
jgi:hypothetical protein